MLSLTLLTVLAGAVFWQGLGGQFVRADSRHKRPFSFALYAT